MSPDPGGSFDTLLTLARRGRAGSAAVGRQYISWIHHHDFARAIRWLVEDDDLTGAVNLASHNPLPDRDFMRELREAAGIPVGLPATKRMLEVGAILMRTESELSLKSPRVIPGVLLEHGFSFHVPDWLTAARQLCADRSGER